MYTPAHAYTHIHPCLRTYIQSITTRAHTRIHTSTQTHTHTHTFKHKMYTEVSIDSETFFETMVRVIVMQKKTQMIVLLSESRGVHLAHI